MWECAARPAGNNRIERGLIRALLFHEPLQLGGDVALPHARLDETAYVLRGTIGNPAGRADTLNFTSGFNLPQGVKRDAAQLRAKRVAPLTAGMPANMLALKPQRAQVFLCDKPV